MPKQPTFEASQRHFPIGAVVNALTVAIGSLIGLFFKHQIDHSYQGILFQAIGLGVMLMGIQMGLKVPGKHWVVLMLGLLFGTLTGLYLDLVDSFGNVASYLKTFFQVEDPDFSQGLVTAFIIFCIGAMTIIGSLEEGLKGNRTIILTKSVLDGFTAMLLSGAYGIGVMFSIIPLFIFQSSITISAYYLHRWLKEDDLNLISGVGGILIVGIGLEMLEIKDIALEDMLPALLFAPVIYRIFDKLNVIKRLSS